MSGVGVSGGPGITSVTFERTFAAGADYVAAAAAHLSNPLTNPAAVDVASFGAFTAALITTAHGLGAGARFAGYDWIILAAFSTTIATINIGDTGSVSWQLAPDAGAGIGGEAFALTSGSLFLGVDFGATPCSSITAGAILLRVSARASHTL